MKLTDTEILHIFCQTVVREGLKPLPKQNQFLSAYADAVRMASKKDFLILRPVSLILIGEYGLGELLQSRPAELTVHNFPGARRRA